MSETILKWSAAVDTAIQKYARNYPRADREDIRQECFLHLLEAEVVIEGIAALAGELAQKKYVAVMLRNRIKSYGREPELHVNRVSLLEAESELTTELGNTFEEMIDGLSPAEKSVLGLLYRDGADQEMAASILDKDRTWVRRTRDRALEKLRGRQK